MSVHRIHVFRMIQIISVNSSPTPISYKVDLQDEIEKVAILRDQASKSASLQPQQKKVIVELKSPNILDPNSEAFISCSFQFEEKSSDYLMILLRIRKELGGARLEYRLDSNNEGSIYPKSFWAHSSTKVNNKIFKSLER